MMKRPKIKSVVLRTKRLGKPGFVGAWAHRGFLTSDLGHLLEYALEKCGKPPYDITIEVR
jgi:hypothetical protein